MKTINYRYVILVTGFLLAASQVTSTASAQANGPYELTSSTIDGGGGTSSGGPYTVTGTIGQPDTGVSSGADYVLSGGFWPGSFGCVVNLTDLSMLAEQWLGTGEGFAADLDENNRVDIGDFAELSYWWYDTCPADWPLK